MKIWQSGSTFTSAFHSSIATIEAHSYYEISYGIELGARGVILKGSSHMDIQFLAGSSSLGKAGAEGLKACAEVEKLYVAPGYALAHCSTLLKGTHFFIRVPTTHVGALEKVGPLVFADLCISDKWFYYGNRCYYSLNSLVFHNRTEVLPNILDIHRTRDINISLEAGYNELDVVALFPHPVDNATLAASMRAFTTEESLEKNASSSRTYWNMNDIIHHGRVLGHEDYKFLFILTKAVSLTHVYLELSEDSNLLLAQLAALHHDDDLMYKSYPVPFLPIGTRVEGIYGVAPLDLSFEALCLADKGYYKGCFPKELGLTGTLVETFPLELVFPNNYDLSVQDSSLNCFCGSSFDQQSCSAHGYATTTAFSDGCKQELLFVFELAKWYLSPLTQLGTTMSLFSETALSGTFHPTNDFNENWLLLEQEQSTLEIYGAFTQDLNKLFKMEGFIPTIELAPIVQGPTFRKSTSRERGAMKIHYAPMQYWAQKRFNGENYTYVADLTTVKQMIASLPLRGYMALADEALHKVQSKQRDTNNKFDFVYEAALEDFQEMDKENHFGKVLQNKIEPVMKFMRMSQVLGNASMSITKASQILEIQDMKRGSIDEYFFLPLQNGEWVRKHDFNNSVDGLSVEYTSVLKESEKLEMVLSCQYLIEHCPENSISHILSERGVCTAFNAVQTDEIFKASPYLQYFQEIYSTPTQANPLPAIQAGEQNGVKLLIDVHQLDILGSEGGHFTVAVNSFLDSHSLIGAHDVFPGQRSRIQIHMLATHAIQNLENTISLHKRSCRFLDEAKESTRFRHYTFKSCIFECQLVRAKNKNKCLPWDIIHTADEMDSPICTRNHTTNFQESFQEAEQSCARDCDSDCNGLTYDVSVDSAFMDPDITCQSGSMQMLAFKSINNYNDFNFWKYIRMSKWKYEALHMSFQDHGPYERCVEKVANDFSFVNIYLASSTIPVATMAQRYQFSEFLSLLGGTLGLWVGFSLLSIVEFLYWIYLGLSRALSSS